MATQPQEFASQAATTKQSIVHPLCPLSSSEISLCADLIRAQWPLNVDLRFKVVTLEEPSKKSLVPYLEAEHGGKAVPSLDRRAFVAYYLRNTVSEASRMGRQLLIP
jgi:primary-amine oxidase